MSDTRRYAYFLAGSYVRERRHIPFSAIRQACNDFVMLLLHESEQRVKSWHQTISQQLGQELPLLTDLIPALRLFAADFAESPLLSPLDSEERSAEVLQKFLGLLATASHPVTLLLENFHWADPASYQLVTELLNRQQNSHLLILGEYQSNEANSCGEFLQVLPIWQRHGKHLRHFSVGPLKPEQLNTLLAETFHCHRQHCQRLHELILTKTRGDAFVVLPFSAPQEAELSKNIENTATIQAPHIADSMSLFMEKRLERLSHDTQNLLKCAACQGYFFDLAILAEAFGRSRRDVLHLLWEAVQTGLVIPLDDRHHHVSVRKETDMLPVHEFGFANNPAQDAAYHHSLYQEDSKFVFTHELLHHGAYALIEESSCDVCHLNIGEAMLKLKSRGDDVDRLLPVMEQLNAGSHLLSAPEELVQLAEWNLQAGRQVKQLAAYAEALNFYRAGIRQLGNKGWKQQPDLTLTLHKEAAECSYACGDTEAADTLLQRILEHTRSETHLAEVKSSCIRKLAAEGCYEDALRLGREALRHLNIRLPLADDESALEKAISKTRIRRYRQCDHQTLPGIDSLPAAADSTHLMAMTLLQTMAECAFFTAPHYLELLTEMLIQRSLEHGRAPSTSFGYALHGLMLELTSLEYKSGRRLAQLSLPQKDTRSDCDDIICTIWEYFWKDLNLSAQKQTECVPLQAVNSRVAAWSTALAMSNRLLGDMPLNDVAATFEADSIRLRRLNIADFKDLGRMNRAVLANLRGQTGNPASLETPDFCKHAFRSRYPEDSAPVQLLRFYKLMLDLLYNRYQMAYKRVLKYRMTTPLFPNHHAAFSLYAALSIARQFTELSADEQQRSRRLLHGHYERIRHLSGIAPKEFFCQERLIAAEIARITNRPQDAEKAYKRAAESAEHASLRQYAALAYEYAALQYFAAKQQTPGEASMAKAHASYTAWGAIAKAQQLEAQYPFLR